MASGAASPKLRLRRASKKKESRVPLKLMLATNLGAVWRAAGADLKSWACSAAIRSSRRRLTCTPAAPVSPLQGLQGRVPGDG